MAASASIPPTPQAEDAETVDHGRVRVRAELGVGESLSVFGRENNPGEVLQVHLMAYPGVRRDHLQGAEGLLAPTEETVTLPVALELEVGIAGEGIRAAGEVGDDRVVDDELGGYLGLHGGCIAPKGDHGVPHCCQVGDHRDTGEVLHEDPGR